MLRPCLAIALIVAMLPATATAQRSKTPEPYYLLSDGAAGVKMFAPGHWGRVAVELVNPTDEAVTLLPAFFVEGVSHIQYAGQFWLPPRSQLSTSYPVYLPVTANQDTDSQQLPVRTLLFWRTKDRGDVLIEDRSGERFRRGLIALQRTKPLSAIIGGGEADEVRRAAIAMNLAAGGTNFVPHLSPDALPPTPESFDALDLLIIAGDEIRDDPAGLAAVRRWLLGGGKLWLMLDKVEPATARAILGDAYRATVVDRLELTTVNLVDEESVTQRYSATADFEEPVELLRVVAPEATTGFTIGNWPAAYWLSFGQGKVLVTTLNARGWYRPWVQADGRDPEVARRSQWVATEPLAYLARTLAEEQVVPRPSEAAESRFVTEEIGYQIVGPATVTAVLGLYCVTLLGVGLWLFSHGSLPQLGWFGPAAALAAAMILVLLGRQTRQAVPPTVAALQIVDLAPGDQELTADGQMAMYVPDSFNGPLGAQQGGLFGDSESLGAAGKNPRMTWQDFASWRYENYSLPAGVSVFPFRYSGQLDTPVRAEARFGPSGLQGTLQAGPFAGLSDGVIVTSSSARTAVRLGDDNSFSAAPADELASGQFVGAAMVDDRRRRRAILLGDVLNPPDRTGYFPQQPTLYLWADPLDMHFITPEDAQRTGAALVSIPLSLQPTPPGEQVLIGASFLPYRTVAAPGKQSAAPTYDNVRKAWIGPVTKETETYLRFQLPQSVLPLELSDATLTVSINAPGRELTIYGLENGAPIEVANRSSPVGTIAIALNNPAALQVDEQGGLVLGVVVGAFAGEASDSISVTGWTIEDVRLQLRGEVVSPTTVSN